MTFCQIVIGPPGSGKTTYCKAMQQFLTAIGRDLAVVNLDPANENVSYKCDINIFELISLGEVMDRTKLGPNGGLIYCMEFLEKHLDWLKKKLHKVTGKHILFDCPGQVELYTHHISMRNILQQLQKWKFRLTCVHLIDSHYCSDPGKFISALLTSLSTMLQMELPHVNVLSKVDLIQKFGKLRFNLDYFTDVLDLSYILEEINDDPMWKKYKKLNSSLVDILQDYSLVSFTPLDIQEKQSMLRVLQQIDKASGYLFQDLENRDIQSLMSYAAGADFKYEEIRSVQEKYVDS